MDSGCELAITGGFAIMLYARKYRAATKRVSTGDVDIVCLKPTFDALKRQESTDNNTFTIEADIGSTYKTLHFKNMKEYTGNDKDLKVDLFLTKYLSGSESVDNNNILSIFNFEELYKIIGEEYFRWKRSGKRDGEYLKVESDYNTLEAVDKKKKSITEEQGSASGTGRAQGSAQAGPSSSKAAKALIPAEQAALESAIVEDGEGRESQDGTGSSPARPRRGSNNSLGSFDQADEAYDAGFEDASEHAFDYDD